MSELYFFILGTLIGFLFFPFSMVVIIKVSEYKDSKIENEELSNTGKPFAQ